MFGGVTVVTWYPITPSSSLCESLIDYMKQHRIDENGKATFAIVQAEDELAAVGMVLGAGWAGARSMTSTAGPGISLMAEFVGLGYFAEIPGVIWDIQRVGPSTGLPTRTAQGDVNQVAYPLARRHAAHRADPVERRASASTSRSEALDLAEQFQTPVFVLSDLDLGMNNWMSDPFEYPTKPIKRGKVLTAEQLTELQGKWGRYDDVDGDGIPWRTLPGTDHPFASYFTRGSGHDAQARYSEKPAGLQGHRRPSREEVRDREAVRAEAGGRSARRREDRLHRLRHDALGARGVARSAAARARASRRATSASARCRSPTS